MSEVREFRDGEASVVLDARFPAMVVSTYFGLTTEKLVRESSAWLGKYMSGMPNNAKLVMVSDTRAVPTSDSKVRKIASEEFKKLEPLMRGHDVEIIIIVNNGMLRGAITAISWLTSSRMLVPAKDLEDAFRLAGESLAKVGKALPLGLTGATYRVPTTAARKTG
jgi:hypothetical protein